MTIAIKGTNSRIENVLCRRAASRSSRSTIGRKIIDVRLFHYRAIGQVFESFVTWRSMIEFGQIRFGGNREPRGTLIVFGVSLEKHKEYDGENAGGRWKNRSYRLYKQWHPQGARSFAQRRHLRDPCPGRDTS